MIALEQHQQQQNENKYTPKTIRFQYNRIGHALVEGIGLAAWFFIKGHLSIGQDKRVLLGEPFSRGPSKTILGNWRLNASISAWTPASQHTSVFFTGWARLKVNGTPSGKKVSFIKPTGTYFYEAGTFPYDLKEPLYLPKSGTVSVEIHLLPVFETPEGRAMPINALLISSETIVVYK